VIFARHWRDGSAPSPERGGPAQHWYDIQAVGGGPAQAGAAFMRAAWRLPPVSWSRCRGHLLPFTHTPPCQARGRE